jgi:hypothetical protein
MLDFAVSLNLWSAFWLLIAAAATPRSSTRCETWTTRSRCCPSVENPSPNLIWLFLCCCSYLSFIDALRDLDDPLALLQQLLLGFMSQPQSSDMLSVVLCCCSYPSFIDALRHLDDPLKLLQLLLLGFVS